MISEQVALVLTANDRSQAAISSFVRGILGISKAHDAAAASARRSSNVGKIIQVDLVEQARAQTALDSATRRASQALQGAVIAAREYSQQLTVQERVDRMNEDQKIRLARATAEVTRAQDAYTRSSVLATEASRKAAEAGAQPARVADLRTAARQRVSLAQERVTTATLNRDIVAGQTPMSGATEEELLRYRRAEEAVTAANIRLADTKRLLVSLGDREAEVTRLAAVAAQSAADATLAQSQASWKAFDAIQAETDVKSKQLSITRLQTIAESENEKATYASARATNTALDAEARRLAAKQNLTRVSAGKLVSDPNYVPPGVNVLRATGGVVGVSAVVGGTLLAIDSARKALEFDAAAHQIAAQTGNTGAKFANIQAAQQVALAFTAGGQSQFSPTQVLQGALLPITQGLAPRVVAQLLPMLAQQSAIFKTPNLQLFGQALVSMSGYQGNIGAITAAQGKHMLDMVTAAEQQTPAQPAAFTAALPALFASAKGSGISTEALMGAEVQLVRSTGAPAAKAAGWLGQLIRSSIIKPTPDALKLASSLGLTMGEAGLRQAGGNPFVYWANLYAGIGGDPQKAARLISGGGGGSGINALRGFQTLNLGGAMAGAATITDMLRSTGTGTRTTQANDELMRGQQQQLVGLQNQFNSDLTKIGTVINKDVLPALIDLAGGALRATENLINSAGGFGHWLDQHFPGGAQAALGPITAIPKLDQVIADYLNQSAGMGRLVHGVRSPNAAIPGFGAGLGIPLSTGAANAEVLNSRIGFMYPWLERAQLASQRRTGPTGEQARYSAATASLPVLNLLGLSGGGVGQNVIAGAIGRIQSLGQASRPAAAGGTAFQQNIYTNQAQLYHQANLLKEYDRGTASLQKYQNKLADFHNALAAGASNKTIEKLRDQLMRLLADPGLALAMGKTSYAKLTSEATVIPKAVRELELGRSPVLADFKKSWIDFMNAISQGASSSNLKTIRDHIMSLVKDPTLLAALSVGKKTTTDALGLIRRDTGVMTADIAKAQRQENIAAATLQMRAADLMYRAVILHHGTLAQANAAAQADYRTAVGVARATFRDAKPGDPNARLTMQESIQTAGEKLASDFATNLTRALSDANVALNFAQETGVGLQAATAKVGGLLKQQLAAGDITPAGYAMTVRANQQAMISSLMPEAQARLQLAQATGVGLQGAGAGVMALLKQQYNQPNQHYQLQLAEYQLQQSLQGPVLPGARLVRPNLPSGGYDATFTGSISRLSSSRAGGEAKIIASLENTIRKDDEIIAELRGAQAERLKQTRALNSIDGKTPPANSGPRGRVAPSWQSVRYPA